jgi:hypothetical protein
MSTISATPEGYLTIVMVGGEELHLKGCDGRDAEKWKVAVHERLKYIKEAEAEEVEAKNSVGFFFLLSIVDHCLSDWLLLLGLPFYTSSKTLFSGQIQPRAPRLPFASDVQGAEGRDGIEQDTIRAVPVPVPPGAAQNHHMRDPGLRGDTVANGQE